MSFTSVYIASPEAANGRNLVAYAVVRAFAQRGTTSVFRPAACKHESFTQVLLNAAGVQQSRESAVAVCPCNVRDDKEGARGDIVRTYGTVIEQQQPQYMVVVGTDKSAVFDPQSFTFNAQVAADLKTPVLLAVCTRHRNAKQLRETVALLKSTVEDAGQHVAGVVVTGCDDERAAEQKAALNEFELPVWTIPPYDCETQEQAEATYDEIATHIPAQELMAALEPEFAQPTTPYAFQADLLAKAKVSRKTIVLPEGEEDRIIKAADYLLERDIVDLIIVGNKDAILARGQELGLQSLDKAQFQAMDDETVLAPMVDKLCELRAKKGMTPEQARKQLADPSYFGTMLVVLGKADGLVSGSINSTANTVRPALQVIKTKPGASLVSGAFLMCFKDHVAIFADCAINLNPNAEQLADIALQSAETARAFGIEPHVGMLSYSTLGSGKGPDVDLVEEATAIVKQKDPELKVVGSIQFDAAWSPVVAATKAKGNDVAGHVNVFVFPDLCAGNIAYKAVQRSSGALAIGPVLQGLNKPVNDLSRGALVEDIINTVALTAVTA